MATILNLSSSSKAQANNLTRCYQLGDCSLGVTAADAGSQQTMRAAGTFSNLYCRLILNTVTANSTLTSRVNAANGNQTITLTASTTGEFEDTTNTDTVTAGQKWNYQNVTGATGTSMTFTLIGMLFAATTNTVKRFDHGATQNLTTASTTFFSKMSGIPSWGTTESTEQVTALTGGTFQNGFVDVTTNTRGTSDTLITRKGGVNGNVTITIAGSATGIMEDTSNTDVVSVNDLWNWACTTGSGSGNLIIECGIDLITTNSTSQYTQVAAAAGTTQSTTVTNYLPVQGNLASTTESDAQAKCNSISTFSNLSINVTANTLVSVSTLKFRKNAANGNQVVSITGTVPGPATGVFTDATNSDTTQVTDKICTQLITADVGTSLTWRWAALKFGPGGASELVGFTYTQIPLLAQMPRAYIGY